MDITNKLNYNETRRAILTSLAFSFVFFVAVFFKYVFFCDPCIEHTKNAKAKWRQRKV